MANLKKQLGLLPVRCQESSINSLLFFLLKNEKNSCQNSNFPQFTSCIEPSFLLQLTWFQEVVEALYYCFLDFEVVLGICFNNFVFF